LRFHDSGEGHIAAVSADFSFGRFFSSVSPLPVSQQYQSLAEASHFAADSCIAFK
jgi:hypothetical protein